MNFYIEFHLTIKLRNTDKFNIFIIIYLLRLFSSIYYIIIVWLRRLTNLIFNSYKNIKIWNP